LSSVYRLTQKRFFWFIRMVEENAQKYCVCFGVCSNLLSFGKNLLSSVARINLLSTVSRRTQKRFLNSVSNNEENAQKYSVCFGVCSNLLSFGKKPFVVWEKPFVVSLPTDTKAFSLFFRMLEENAQKYSVCFGVCSNLLSFGKKPFVVWEKPFVVSLPTDTKAFSSLFQMLEENAQKYSVCFGV